VTVAVPPAAAAAVTLIEVELTRRLVVLSLGGDSPLTSYGANCVAIAGASGTLLVDPLIAPAHAQLVARVLARRGFPAVSHVVVTHHHTDHALGAGWFAARGAAVIAHERCAAAMASQHAAIIDERRGTPDLAALFADAEPYVPARTFNDRIHIDLGDIAVEARHLGPGHTAGDAVVLFPSEHAVACGDLVCSGYHFNYEEADLPGLPRAQEALHSVAATRYIPGHGVVAGGDIVQAQARYHNQVEQIIATSQDREEARAAIRAQFVGYKLSLAIESALDRWPSRWHTATRRA